MKIISEKPIPLLFKRKSDCCGCTACFAICPRNAILMKTDSEGFEYPYINEKECVRCYQCVNVCPIKKIKNKG